MHNSNTGTWATFTLVPEDATLFVSLDEFERGNVPDVEGLGACEALSTLLAGCERYELAFADDLGFSFELASLTPVLTDTLDGRTYKLSQLDPETCPADLLWYVNYLTFVEVDPETLDGPPATNNLLDY